MEKYEIKKRLLIACGIIALLLGLIGMAIPVFPTTPFLLLSAYCFMKSSEKMYKWMLSNRLFGDYLYSYITYRAILRKTKITTIIFLWLMLLVSFLLVAVLPVRIFLILVGIGVTVHLLMLPTLNSHQLEELATRHHN